ncbi:MULTISPECIES: hypothetical protein [unclassified Coleofasciculus]|uniref:hypothetical protein n=1 Tax=unclassified Coleofasciculus TaxID=2692782 RepID=UPI00187E1839|nr:MULTISPECIES: hypothetical protein [unclassified Coleofasciculus]MBE9125599.1 hypothetical protein [Coleofasciculus sp. LEGE 07081]MBE9147313.1 hypothetical protein [Coleofasciculus sp. LEGE 07092]
MARVYRILIIDGNLAAAGDQPAAVKIGEDLIEYFSIPGATSGTSTPEKTVTVPASRRFKTLQDAAAGTNPVPVGGYTRKYHLIPAIDSFSGGRSVEVDTKIEKAEGTVHQTSFRVSNKATIASISAFIATWGATNRPKKFSIQGKSYPVLLEADIKGAAPTP